MQVFQRAPTPANRRAFIDFRTISAPVQIHLDQFEQKISEISRSDVEVINQIWAHLVRTKGKRLRPALVFLSASAYGTPCRETMLAAFIIELCHTATLIHDDVVDRATTRRGLPTLNSKWDNHVSVLMGDNVIARVLTLIAKLDCSRITAKIAACVERLTEGELHQAIRRFNIRTTEAEYYRIISNKTSSLIACGCDSGAYLSSRSAETACRFGDFGEKLGMAFQITDDILNFTGDEDVIGKPRGNDFREGTVTLPLIHALRNASTEGNRRVEQLMKEEWSDRVCDEIVEFVHVHDGIRYAKGKALAYAEEAKRSLRDEPETRAKDALLNMVDYAIERDR
ncbi:MAG: polyprenyl synthetase family protein [Gemmatimonadetes bacterium]|nr:polyprenyl synthetase family protein [Gemmatimonadota bacterium]MYB61495.1 polyprenyl synthetase family protein [Gemmatimonadota bacterium]